MIFLSGLLYLSLVLGHSLIPGNCLFITSIIDTYKKTLLWPSVSPSTVEAIGCYQCISGGTFPRDEACEVGRRSANYANICIPRGEPPQGVNARVYCVKAIGSESNDDRVGPITIRGCSYTYRTDCREGINVDGRIIRGCVYSCADGDFCNGSTSTKVSVAALTASAVILFVRFSSWK